MIADASMIEVGETRASVQDAPRNHHAPTAVRRGARSRYAYDAAQTHAGNQKHWAEADSLSAQASLTPFVRKTLRSRSRYEVANNPYARGIVDTLASDTVMSGPRLQLLTDNRAEAREVERGFARWAREVRLAEKLRTAWMAEIQDGESFMMLGNNPKLRNGVQLDIRNVECDQIADPSFNPDNDSDGVVYDPWGNPRAYMLLRAHPGDADGGPAITADEIPADQMIHCFRCRRPGQKRGLPELTPALPLFAILRRYTLAVLTSAEIAADMAGILYTDAPADENGYDVDPLDTFEVVRGMFTSMPAGWKINQLKAEQPTTVYPEFKNAVLNEIARCLAMPFNIAAGNSSGYNYASGRLDHQVYQRAITVSRHQFGITALDHIFREWLKEASLVTGLLPQRFRTINADLTPHEWHWDGFKHADPDKESRGDERNLKTGRLTIPAMHSEAGNDWEEAQESQAKALGLSIEDYRSRLADYLLGPSGSEPTDEGGEAAENADQEQADE